MPNPPSVKKLTLELHGHYAGKTVKLAGVNFVEGKVKLFGATKDIDGLVNYLGKCYQALPVEEQKDDGTNKVQETTRQGNSEEVSSDLQQIGTGPSEETPILQRSLDDSNLHGDRSLPSGDGHEDPRLSEATERFNATNHSQIEPMKLLKALQRLDPTVEENWTSQGLPRMDVVCKFYGSEGLTRKNVEAVWPEFNRELQVKNDGEKTGQKT